MTKYRMHIEVEFETEANLPVFHAQGSMTVLGGILDELPDPPDDIDEDKAHGRVSLTVID